MSTAWPLTLGTGTWMIALGDDHSEARRQQRQPLERREHGAHDRVDDPSVREYDEDRAREADEQRGVRHALKSMLLLGENFVNGPLAVARDWC